MMKNEGIYASLITIIILLAFIVPYTFLTNVEKWYGSFLFWILLTIIVIGLVFLFIKDWGKEG